MKDFVQAWWKKALIVVAIVAVGIQFVPFSVEEASARDHPQWDSARTEELFDRACADCHSNRTKMPWYESVAPVKWFVAHHVEEGRESLNVDQWHTAAARDLDELTEVIEEKEMPIDSYTWFGLHSEANLTDAERKELIAGLKATVAADPPTLSGKGEGGEGDGDD